MVYNTTVSRGGFAGFQRYVAFPVDLRTVSSSYNDRFKAIHITSDLPISLDILDGSSYGSSRYLALPCHDYQISQYEYYTISTGSYRNTTMSQALLVGCQNNTTVTITPSVDLFLPNNVQEPDIDIVVSKGISHTVLLHEGQTLYFGAPDVDITGTHIVSDKPLTVITGHECGTTLPLLNFCNHMQQQVPPSLTWGNKFILPFFQHNSYTYVSGLNYVKVVTSEVETTISLFCNDTNNTATYSAGGSVYSFFYNNTYNCYLKADKPIFVVVYPKSISMIAISPTEQFSQQVDFTIGYVNYQIIYIIVTTTPVGFSPSAILYNGQPITNWTTVYDSSMNIVGYIAEFSIRYSWVSSLGNISIVHTNDEGRISVYYYDGLLAMPAGVSLNPINKCKSAT